MSEADFQAMLLAQGGTCAICSASDWGKRGPMVDHDHLTGRVRGILCGRCNTALGMLKDSAGLLRSAIWYLGKDKA